MKNIKTASGLLCIFLSVAFSVSAEKVTYKCHVKVDGKDVITHFEFDNKARAKLINQVSKYVSSADGKSQVPVDKVIECTTKREFILYSSRKVEKSIPG